MVGCANPRAVLRCFLSCVLLQRWAVGLEWTLASPRARRWLHEATIATPDGINVELVEQQLVVPLTLKPARVELRMHDDTVLCVTTRTFNGSVPAPTLVVTPGDHLVFDIANDLGPGAANRTSLHLHGLHIGHDGVALAPGSKRIFKYIVPSDHPSGTFWYHPHVHGLLNAQIGGLLAGALVVLDRPGDLPAQLSSKNDHVILIQAVCAKDCGHEHDATARAIEGHMAAEPSGHFKSRLESNSSGLYTLVNGLSVPIIDVQPFAWTRLRYINAIANNLVEIASPAANNCTTLLLARDGITLQTWSPLDDALVVPPGGRADVLVQCPPQTEDVSIDVVKDLARSPEFGHHHRVPSQPLLRLRIASALEHMVSAVSAWPQPLHVSLPSYMTVPPELPRACNYNYTFIANDTAMSGYGVNGEAFSMESRDSIVVGSPQLWCVRIAAPGDINHPFHIHNTHFHVLGQAGWRDTVPLLHGTLQLWFRPSVVGPTMTHCHIAVHADMGMARVVDVEPLTL
ncbi:hypothetical protein SDRG_00988 [Saprolegnia diclina VS20]|uniref:Plastocyanin-like domain-containing protein n=1 Tax=Saprolegnia diclina (strain VS20) TaxID=1156394 RepID=T0SA15_SAPDV|nr:hypothetical protein SDRG_00988 [Saprolegnia diclina VS20]EQC42148.1 hypothetical protein SDRG_00988 [Saprolegnia diclina VS20]|eukprot:XP_008604717.1 hypothetical protein SDRG_00988 [Saprolegnia diclina VS20]